MVTLQAVRSHNSALKTGAAAGLVGVFVGATRGIGLKTLSELVKGLEAPRFYVVGRSRAKFAAELEKLQTLNPGATVRFIEAQVSLLRDVDAVCEEVKKEEGHLDLLVMSQGALPTGVPKATEEGIDECLAVCYYSRMRFLSNLLPLLQRSARPRVVSVLAGGQEKALFLSDPELRSHYSFQNVLDQATAMHTLALEHLAQTAPHVSFLHVFPGLVATDIMPNFIDAKPGLLGAVLRALKWAILPLFRLLAFSAEESGQRQAFHATSELYPSAEEIQAGTAVAEAMQSTLKGNGVYLVREKGETVTKERVLEAWRAQGAPAKVWDHTVGVFERAGR
ncbi:uncharacterized protein K452DRAFT_357212 [Aplosporella prunicola CBS 121167]|uniref:Ketoreductase (KR) domain-containing protein n=1 Tax=Aplosporella prunicola CBS 121167 TaxID=1176127 RepID=A0A6A6BJI9_9PEZI|nr:uncharacterized protein K452DRAFT_357212 [Aplosporella prunicola CBS 121167]KAF2143543.1 hypothetical protein K452DRAFT_357212 [Aplosporella prunicola CBS 121167]